MKSYCFIKSNLRTTALWGLIIGLPFLFLILFLSSCEVSKEEVGFSRIYIYNKSTTNDYDTFTNIDMIKYNPDTMANTVNGMSNRNIDAMRTFTTDRTIFPWNNTRPISIEKDKSYEILTYDCGASGIILVDKNTNVNINIYEKYNFAVVPLECGIEYQISFTNSVTNSY